MEELNWSKIGPRFWWELKLEDNLLDGLKTKQLFLSER